MEESTYIGRRRTYIQHAGFLGSLHGGWGPLDEWAGEPPFGQGVEGELFAVLLLSTLRWEDNGQVVGAWVGICLACGYILYVRCTSMGQRIYPRTYIHRSLV